MALFSHVEGECYGVGRKERVCPSRRIDEVWQRSSVVGIIGWNLWFPSASLRRSGSLTLSQTACWRHPAVQLRLQAGIYG